MFFLFNVLGMTLNIFIDTNIFLKLIEGTKREQQQFKTLLKHAKNAGFNFTTSLTVYGEALSIGLAKKRKHELHIMIELIRDFDIQCWTPNSQLRKCCKCLDKIDKENRVGPSDRTHLAYSMTYNDDFFLTTDGDLHHFPVEKCKCKLKCGRNNKTEGKIILPDNLKMMLQKKKIKKVK